MYAKHGPKIISLVTDVATPLDTVQIKYGTYSLMSTDINKIVDFHVVHVGIAGNSSRMEKKGLEILLEKLQKFDLKITSLTTVHMCR